MNAIELLTQQHTEVDELIQQLEQGDGDAQAAFDELADKLAGHATIEEKIFYPAVMAKQTEEKLLESVEEHLAIKRVLADMLELDVSDDQFKAKLAVLKEELEHHAHEEEEGDLFPKVKKLISADELEGLGNEMMAMFEDLLEQDPRFEIPEQIDTAAPL